MMMKEEARKDTHSRIDQRQSRNDVREPLAMPATSWLRRGSAVVGLGDCLGVEIWLG